ncbi:hypothetical protein BOV91_11395, partial [Solemya velum gill symbiont]
ARIQFDEDPKIDFAHIIRLIQTEPDRFKLEGQDKLRFTADFDDPLTRVDKLESLLARLQNK